jgi:predicted nucleic acid-binding protein
MRFVVDAGAVIEIVKRDLRVAPGHELLAPTLVRSQVLSRLHEAGEPREILQRVNALKLRLLGDAVLRRRAWEIADELGWQETYDAEYLALTQLQADAFVTTDKALARRAKAVVTVATLDDLA